MVLYALALLKSDRQRDEMSEFYRKNKKRFFKVALLKLNRKEAAEDAIQEAFARIAENPETFFRLEHNKRLAFVDIIIRNVAVDMFRKNCREKSEELSEEILSSVSGEASLEDVVIGSISERELLDFIETLPALQRDVITLKAVCGLTNTEIAEKLNISENAVRQRIFKARNSIKKFLDARDREEQYE